MLADLRSRIFQVLSEDSDGEIKNLLERIINWERSNPPRHEYHGFYWHEVHGDPRVLNKLVTRGILKVVLKTNSGTAYRLIDLEATEDALKSYERIIEETPREEAFEVPSDILDIVIGHEDKKEIIMRALKSPKRCHILLYGSPASIPGDERVVVETQNGIETPEIREVYERFINGEALKALCVNPKTFKTEFKPIIAVSAHSKNSLLKVYLATGRTVRATVDHSFVVYDPYKHQLVPKKGSELVVGDILPVVSNFAPSEVIETIQIMGRTIELTEELGFFIGLWLAEGSVNRNHRLISIHNNELELLEACRTYACRILPSKYKNYKGGCIIRKAKDRKTLVYVLRNDITMELLNQFILSEGEKRLKGRFARFKRLTPWAMAGPEQFIRGLLRGYFTGDGTILKNGEVYALSASPILITHLSLLLQRLGIVPVIRDVISSPSAIKYGMYRYLKIPRCDLERFLSTIGFAGSKALRAPVKFDPPKHDELFVFPLPRNPVEPGQLRSAIRQGLKTGDKYLTKYSMEKLLEFCEANVSRIRELIGSDLRWVRITKIEHVPFEGLVYDLTVEGNSNFVLANGVVVHNSAKSLILECLGNLPGAKKIIGSSSTKAGLFELLYSEEPRFLLIDEIDKMENPQDLSILLSLMETGRISETKFGRRRLKTLDTRVIAAANKIDRIPPELLSRFIRLRFRDYTDDEFLEVATKVLERRENLPTPLAIYIAEQVLRKLKSRDVRDAIKVARLLREPVKEDVDRIIELLKRQNI